MRYKEIIENMDHDKDSGAVEELHAALIAHKSKLQDADDDQVYDIIDKIMTRIARSHSISGQKLHDMWVDKYKQIPDTWIMNESAGIDFDMTFDDDTGSFATVTARAHGRVLGSVKFFMDGDTLEADMVEVDERYRGQGIAAAMYDYAKSQGYTIEKSSDLTPDGDHFWNKNRGEQAVWENTAAGINKMFNNLGDPVYANLQRVALLAMQGRQQEAQGRLNSVIKDASPQVQKKIIDAVNVIKPVTINGRVADSSTLDKSKAHQDWILNTFIPWVQSLLGQQGVAENFHDGRNPQDKGDSKRYGVPTKASVSTLRKVAKQGGRKGQLAHWMANMKAGKKKHHE